MNAQAAVLGAVSVQAALRVLQLTLQLYASWFPQQAYVRDGFSYDFIIVGAGTAGCVLARRLSDNANASVLLIEAGGDPTLEVMVPGLVPFTHYSQFDWNYTSENDGNAYQCYQDGVYHTARGHGLGGSSSINYLMYVRGDPNDYPQWAAITNDTTWDWNHVLPYFKKSEQLEDQEVLNSSYGVYHGTKGEMKINRYPKKENIKYLNALNEIGYKTVLDTNGNNTSGFTFPMYNLAKGTRQSTCYCFVSPVKERKNLHVLKNTKATRIIFKDNVAVGVEVTTDTNEKMILKANLEVILSAGVFNTPQLLMLSGVGPKEHLQSFNITTIADLPVGYNLQDHTGVIIAHQMEKSKTFITPHNPFNPPIDFINGFVTLNNSKTYPDYQVLLVPSDNAQSILQLFAFYYRYENYISKKIYDENKNRNLILAYIFNMLPISRGRVMLRSSNPADLPKVYLGSYSDKQDVDNVLQYVKDYLRIENSTYFRSVNARRVDLAGEKCTEFQQGSEEYWRCYSLCLMTSIYHYSSTCPMGTVVDSKLRVLGVRRLRVVDASIFPVIPSGNTNAPTIMVAEKAADMIMMEYFNSS